MNTQWKDHHQQVSKDQNQFNYTKGVLSMKLLFIFPLSIYFFLLSPINGEESTVRYMGKTYQVIKQYSIYFIFNNYIYFNLSNQDSPKISCNEFFSEISNHGTVYALEKCQKELTSNEPKMCEILKFRMDYLLHQSGTMRPIIWSPERDFISPKNQSILRGLVADKFKTELKNIRFIDFNGEPSILPKWTLHLKKPNRNFELVRNFNLINYNPQILTSSGNIQIEENLTRCSLELGESELTAEKEIPVLVPTEINPSTQKELVTLYEGFRSSKFLSLKNPLYKLVVVGAYIGFNFHELDFNSEGVFNHIYSVFKTLFNENLTLKKDIDFEAYKNLMNIKDAEIPLKININANMIAH